MEVSRYRPLRLAGAQLLVAFLCLAVALALDTSSWLDIVVGFATVGAVYSVLDRFVSRRRLLARFEKARPLPLGAVAVSAFDRDVLLLAAFLFAVILAIAAGEALLFHDGTAATLGLLGGIPVGQAMGSVRDSRTLADWEADNGRLFVESGRGTYWKRGLFVEDPAAAPLDAW